MRRSRRRGLRQKESQAVKEGGLILTLPEDNAAGATANDGLVSEGKDKENNSDVQGKVDADLKEKPVSASSSDIETEPEGKRNGTAAPQNELPGAKVAKADETAKDSGGKVAESGDKITLNVGGKTVTIRKNFWGKGKKIADKNWVLTAYDEMAADGNTSAIASTNQVQAAPDTANSSAKVAKADETAKDSGGKVVENGEAVPTEGERVVGSAVLEIAKESTDVVADKAEMQRVLNENLSEIWQYLNTPSEEVLALSPKDAAKLQKDAETAIAKDNYLQKMTVWHG